MLLAAVTTHAQTAPTTQTGTISSDVPFVTYEIILSERQSLEATMTVTSGDLSPYLLPDVQFSTRLLTDSAGIVAGRR